MLKVKSPVWCLPMSDHYELLTARADILPYVKSIAAAADRERKAFGFLPARAYEEFAFQGRLIVAVDSETRMLAGYIAYGGTAPQARIFQTYVVPEHRRKGLARRLVDGVIERAERNAFLSIRVEIAADLFDASDFYNSCGFRRVREKPGGKTTGRLLVTRVRELQSPSLLDFAAYGRPEGPPIRLSLPTATNALLYLVDLNVYFDVLRRRANAHSARRIFSAALDNAVSLAISAEFVSELERNVREGEPDPVLEFALTLPRLKPPSASVAKVLTEDLAPVIFPERAAEKKLRAQDLSDLRHLATAIDQNAAGFITSEKAILRCSEWLRARYRVDVLSPEVFGNRYTSLSRTTPAYRIRMRNRDVAAGEVAADERPAASEFLKTLDVPPNVVRAALATGSSVHARQLASVQDNGQIVALASWTPPRENDRSVRLYLFADETSPVVQTAVDHMVDVASRHATANRPAILHVTLPPEQAVTRSRLLALGFRPPENSGTRAGQLLKLSLGMVVTQQNWRDVRDELRALARIELPSEPPIYTSHDDEILLKSPSGEHATASLWELEEFVGPCVFALQGRPAALVPIRPTYAEALFRGTMQPSFLNDKQAAVLNRRVYLSNASTYNQIPENGLIVFYESFERGRGRSAATAMARVVRRYLAPEGIAQRSANDRGVLSAEEVAAIAKGKAACVTEFDNLMMFSRPVRLSRLKTLGCADEANVVTARRLAPTSLEKLIAEGAPRCSQ